jgi:uncharacterized membrane protein YphA (DoxX/SURF4 family)
MPNKKRWFLGAALLSIVGGALGAILQVNGVATRTIFALVLLLVFVAGIVIRIPWKQGTHTHTKPPAQEPVPEEAKSEQELVESADEHSTTAHAAQTHGAAGC